MHKPDTVSFFEKQKKETDTIFNYYTLQSVRLLLPTHLPGIAHPFNIKQTKQIALSKSTS
ncbi:Uncharacterised protein [Porphyromonas macacae]|uniref:Uncharacterized protein n=1 Tax=Porphyromonas macacae TaxID=28115 RepID=A0A379DKX7_9PORP|nr:Uncharacterised protein [Porphyromonas macacae]